MKPQGARRRIANTNIVVASLAEAAHPTIALWNSVGRDDEADAAWFKTLRPRHMLVDPAEAFNLGVKLLRPAIQFATFDAALAKRRRAQRRAKHAEATEANKAARLAPPKALKAALNPKKLPPEAVEAMLGIGSTDAAVTLDPAEDRDEYLEQQLLGDGRKGRVRKAKKRVGRAANERPTVVGDAL
jgi:hypothetical protein